MTPGISVLEIEPIREALGNGCLKTVVVGIRRRLLVGDAAKDRSAKFGGVRMVLVEETTLIGVSGARIRSDKQRRIDFPSRQQVDTGGADVSNLEHIVLPELPLDVHVVLMRVGRLEVRIIDRHADRSNGCKVKRSATLDGS